jgi:hypothetical protein
VKHAGSVTAQLGGEGASRQAGAPGQITEPARRARADAKSAQEGLLLTEAQVAALEKAKTEKEAHGSSRASIQVAAVLRIRSMSAI